MSCERTLQISDGHRTDHLFSETVKSFLGIYLFDLLPLSVLQQTGTVILNTDPHTQQGTHWLAIHFQPKSSTAFYFDSYGQPPPSDLNILSFLTRNLLSGIITLHHCKGLQASCAVTTVAFSPSTWTSGTHRNSLCDCLPLASQIVRSCSYSPETSDPCAGSREVGSAAYPNINGKYYSLLLFL